MVAFGILFIAVRWLAGGSDEPLRVNVDNRRSAIDQTCQDAENQEVCKQNALQQTAMQTGDLEFCQGLAGEIYDECIWGIADKQNDPAMCVHLLEASKQQLCADGLHLRVALLSADSSECDKIVNEQTRNGCVETLRGPLTVTNCEERGGDADQCKMLSVSAQASTKQDRRLCDALTGDLIFSCYDLVAIDDPDFDGLSTDEEINTYNSNPDVSDTDGDGYNDGDEVTDGYNPNGSGKLEID